MVGHVIVVSLITITREREVGLIRERRRKRRRNEKKKEKKKKRRSALSMPFKKISKTDGQIHYIDPYVSRANQQSWERFFFFTKKKKKKKKRKRDKNGKRVIRKKKGKKKKKEIKEK